MKTININNFEEKLIYEKLSNGLEIYMIPNKLKKNFFCMMVTKFGGKDLEFKIDNNEYKVPSGVAHFLEHKLFESSDLKPFNFYAKSGTDVNAVTTYDYTGYYFSGNNDFNNNLIYIINWLNHFSITKEKVDKEKGIILEEAHMYKDVPERVLIEKLNNNTFIKSNKRLKVIGQDNDIKNITKEDLELCYNTFYTPNNMALLITGNFDYEEALKIIKEEYKKIKKENVKVTIKEEQEPDEVLKEYEEINMNIELPKLGICYKLNKDKFSKLNINNYLLDYYIFMVLTLGFGNTSEFYEELYKQEKFISFDYDLSDIKDHYIITLYSNTNKEKELEESIDNYVNNINLNEQDFERIKKSWISTEIKASDSINASLYNILDDILDYNEYKNNKITDIKNLDFKTLEEVKELLDFSAKSTVIVK